MKNAICIRTNGSTPNMWFAFVNGKRIEIAGPAALEEVTIIDWKSFSNGTKGVRLAEYQLHIVNGWWSADDFAPLNSSQEEREAMINQSEYESITADN